MACSPGAPRARADHERAQGFVTATAVDPFGNLLGVMHNPHYVEILATR